jgi:SET domain-containing protein
MPASKTKPYVVRNSPIHGRGVFATRTIRKGDELAYDYRLHIDGRITKAMREAYACRCGTRRCRGSLLDEKKKKAK